MIKKLIASFLLAFILVLVGCGKEKPYLLCFGNSEECFLVYEKTRIDSCRKHIRNSEVYLDQCETYFAE